MTNAAAPITTVPLASVVPTLVSSSCQFIIIGMMIAPTNPKMKPALSGAGPSKRGTGPLDGLGSGGLHFLWQSPRVSHSPVKITLDSTILVRLLRTAKALPGACS